MRRAAALTAFAAVAAVLALASSAWADGGEPVTMDVNVPGVVASGIGFPVSVKVTSGSGALSSATAPLRVRVKAATECGATFDSTPGAVLVDAHLGPSGTVAGRASTTTFGTFTACAFLEQQGDDRLYAFDDSTSFAVTHGCTIFTRRAVAARKALRKTRKAARRAHGARRAALQRKAARLHVALKRASTGQHRACSG
jgi:hypothetical protein